MISMNFWWMKDEWTKRELIELIEQAASKANKSIISSLWEWEERDWICFVFANGRPTPKSKKWNQSTCLIWWNFFYWRLNELSESKRKTKSFYFDWMRANGIVAFSLLDEWVGYGRCCGNGSAQWSQRKERKQRWFVSGMKPTNLNGIVKWMNFNSWMEQAVNWLCWMERFTKQQQLRGKPKENKPTFSSFINSKKKELMKWMKKVLFSCGERAE